jgi:uncharacterized membrane protein YqiK
MRWQQLKTATGKTIADVDRNHALAMAAALRQWAGWQTVGSVSRRSIVLRCREQVKRRYYGALPRSKKGIPVNQENIQ